MEDEHVLAPSKRKICGITRVIAGRTFTCVREPHDNGSGWQDTLVNPYTGYYPVSQRHHFKKLWESSGGR